MRTRRSYFLGVSLLVCFTGFAIVSGGAVVNAVKILNSWPAVDAVVMNVKVDKIDRNEFGLATVSFRYALNGLSRMAVAYRSGFSPPKEEFMKRYAVGSKHRIRLNPSNIGNAELDVGLNLDFLFLPLTTSAIALVLLAAGVYFLRSPAKRFT